jgi:hypothetical protein
LWTPVHPPDGALGDIMINGAVCRAGGRGRAPVGVWPVDEAPVTASRMAKATIHKLVAYRGRDAFM